MDLLQFIRGKCLHTLGAGMLRKLGISHEETQEKSMEWHQSMEGCSHVLLRSIQI